LPTASPNTPPPPRGGVEFFIFFFFPLQEVIFTPPPKGDRAKQVFYSFSSLRLGGLGPGDGRNTGDKKFPLWASKLFFLNGHLFLSRQTAPFQNRPLAPRFLQNKPFFFFFCPIPSFFPLPCAFRPPPFPIANLNVPPFFPTTLALYWRAFSQKFYSPDTPPNPMRFISPPSGRSIFHSPFLFFFNMEKHSPPFRNFFGT